MTAITKSYNQEAWRADWTAESGRMPFVPTTGQTRSAHSVETLRLILTGCIIRGLQRLLLWQQRARERRELLAMDERLRKDIGISALDVWREANKPF